MNLHQVPSPRISKPETIAEAFTAWSALVAFGNVAEDDATANALCEARAGLERHALTLQAHSALDVWKLIAMTMDKPDDDRIDYSADAVIVRAHREVTTKNEVARFDQAAGL
ncbi:hypothetical protein [Deinococcus sp.]|uniref:hypothetical protein n=1 Tax=Deinococcus sp. TaxID=47478 RepID=UPI00286E141B|nr:hypothetical protein [Deinococcus sp.]